MRYRWLGLTTFLSRLGTPLTVLASVLIFGAVAGIILLTAGLLAPAVRTSFVALLSIVFAVPYAVKVAQVVRALGRPSVRARGLKLERASAPRLYELIDETARRLGLRPPGGIWLTMGSDAKTITSGAEPDLLLGLPLLDAVSADELRAIVAVILARPFTGNGRTSAAYRDSYLTAVPATNAYPVQDAEGRNSTLFVDLSASYNINDNFTVSLEAVRRVAKQAAVAAAATIVAIHSRQPGSSP